MGRERGGYGWAGHENTRKNSPETNRFGVWERPLGLQPRVIHFRQIFSGIKFPSQIVCLYLELFKSKTASKLTVATKI